MDVTKNELIDFLTESYNTKVGIEQQNKGVSEDIKEFAKSAGVKPKMIKTALRRFSDYMKGNISNDDDISIYVDEYFIEKE